jgi:hypothetical protein
MKPTHLLRAREDDSILVYLDVLVPFGLFLLLFFLDIRDPLNAFLFFLALFPLLIVLFLLVVFVRARRVVLLVGFVPDLLVQTGGSKSGEAVELLKVERVKVVECVLLQFIGWNDGGSAAFEMDARSRKGNALCSAFRGYHRTGTRC